jgi:Domain of unknown function (DUF5666)
MNGIRSRAPSWFSQLTTWVACVALIASCGGGVGTGGTGAFASGPITGFGSIIVGGVHFDESAARIEGDDGVARDRSELRLGTVVDVDSGEVSNGEAVASRVRIVSALIGRVDSVDTTTLVVNGESVRVNATTVFDDRFAGGLAGVAVGRVVEIYGFVFGGSGDLLATRVEPNDGATTFKFRGIVAALDTTARSFRIGTQDFIYPGSVAGLNELRNGALVRVIVATTRDTSGRWTVNSISSGVPVVDDRSEAHANGLITSFTSSASFEVDGRPVDASGARIEGGPLAAGQRVEVEGRLQAGVLVASEVQVENEEGDDELELRGTIASVDTVAKTFGFSGRSERVSYARTDIVYENGGVADLMAGRSVRVTGMLSADRTQVDARRIRFDN